MGFRDWIGGTYQETGRTYMLTGDLAAARAALELGDQMLAENHERSFRSTVLAILADVAALQGDRAATLDAIERAEQLGGKDDLINFVLTHGARSTIAVADGDRGEAERWARSALNYAYMTDFFWARAQTQLRLSEVLAARGDSEGARAAARAALEISVRKGDRPGTAVAEAQLERL